MNFKEEQMFIEIKMKRETCMTFPSNKHAWPTPWIKSTWILFNKNSLTGPVNCKKTTRHHVHLSLCAKLRKTNDAKSRKFFFFLTILRSNISKLQTFLKNRFHSNWRSYLVLTSGQKPKKLLELFLRKISKCLILG